MHFAVAIYGGVEKTRWVIGAGNLDVRHVVLVPITSSFEDFVDAVLGEWIYVGGICIVYG